MPLVHTPGDVTLFTAGGENILCNHNDVELGLDSTVLDGSCIGRDGTDDQPVGGMGDLRWGNLSNKGSSDLTRLIGRDVTLLELGGVDYGGAWTSFSLKITYVKKDQKGGRDYSARNQPLRKRFELTLDLNCFPDVASAILAAAASTNPADKTTTVGLTIGTTAISFPARIKSAKFKSDRDGFQTINVVITGRDSGTGAYPTTPTGTTGLLLKAFNDFKNPIAFAFTSAASDGFAASGFVTFSDVTMTGAIDQFVQINYAFDTYGDVAIVATGS